LEEILKAQSDIATQRSLQQLDPAKNEFDERRLSRRQLKTSE